MIIKPPQRTVRYSFAQTVGSKFMEEEMGRVKEWLMDMEEDAMFMSQEEWCAKHGESVIEVYHEARRKFAEHVEGNDE